jgi:hypothetical protein
MAVFYPEARLMGVPVDETQPSGSQTGNGRLYGAHLVGVDRGPTFSY